MTKGETALNLFGTGLACSQAVALSFKDELGIDETTLANLSLGFGGGFGRQRLVCGAVSGMVMAISALVANGKTKLDVYKIIQDACKDFTDITGSLICAELLGEDPKQNTGIPEQRTAEYYKKRPCGELCQIAADIAKKYIDLYKA